MAKRTTTTSRKPTAARSRKPTQRKRQQPPPFEFSLRPEQQRDLFALFLIAIAAITIVLFILVERDVGGTLANGESASVGVLGKRWVDLTTRLFGWGAVIVPLTLGLLGIAIFWQERREDLPLTGANVLGTLMVLMSLLVLLEFGVGVRPADITLDKVEKGGGIVGFLLLTLFNQGFGRAAAFVGYCLLGLAGIVLTFNIGLKALIMGMRDNFARFLLTIWSASPAQRLPDGERRPPTELPTREALPFVPPPGAEDDALVPTPIAARPARASLFDRPEVKAKAAGAPKPAASPKEQPPAKAAAGAQPGANTLLTSLLTTPTGSQAAPTPTVQATLDGFDVPATHHAWPLPSYDLLEHSIEANISDDERRGKARLIEETLASFKVEAQVVGVNTGPAVTQFELQPAVGVKVSKITTLEKDLALALAAHSIRIEAPIPGKAVVGIEIPNSAISVVGMRDVVESEEFDGSKAKLKLPLGKDVSGTAVIAGMERMPHLLVAGSTGTGKSVAINCYVCALLLKFTPEELKIIMVDPKMVELIVYNQIPHLLSPVVTELERVVPTLKWATREMERRYKIFAKHGFRNLDSYKAAARRRADLEPMPYIVIIIDELADLMMMAPDEVETLICRLAQMARATGIHLIIATQRPSVDVVTGLIKANFPSRIAFAVTSQIDSRVILDMNGAEQLLGRGDMLYMAPDAAKPIRVQGTFVSEGEVERIVAFWRNARPPDQERGSRGAGEQGSGNDKGAKEGSTSANPQPPISNLKGPGEFLSVDEQDELLPEAIKLVKQHKRASASLLQRRLRIGYSKAAQLIELLEQQGVVGPADEGRSRQVLQAEED